MRGGKRIIDFGIPTRLEEGVAIHSEAIRVTSDLSQAHLSPVLSLENDFPRYRIISGGREADKPASGGSRVSGGSQSAAEKRVALGGDDDDGGGGDVEPPAPMITSGGPLLPRTTPSFYVPDGRAHIRGVSG